MHTDTFSIRPAERADAGHIAGISLAVTGSVGVDPREAMADPGRFVVVAETQGAIVGWAKTHHFAEDAGSSPSGEYLGGVRVLPDFRRRGIGLALTQARMDWISNRAAEVWFFTSARNVASMAMHKRFGFIEVARASEIHGVQFDGGLGILFHVALAEVRQPGR